MKVRAFSITLAVMLLISVLAVTFNIEKARSSPNTWTVDDDGPADFTTIRDAVNSSLVIGGDTVYVHSGVYRENITLSKSIWLKGEDPLTTFVDASASEFFPPIHIFNTTDAVVTNFTVQNTSLTESYGILISKARNVTIQNVTVTNTYYGIMISNSTQCRILDNKMVDNYNSGIVFRDNSSYNLIVGNLIADNPTGVQLFGSWYNSFYRNNIVSNAFQVKFFPPFYFAWDNGAEGNYWSDYQGLDDGSGGRNAGDGIGDTNLPHQGVDSHPLLDLWSQTRTFPANSHSVAVNCNYTVASFNFNDTLDQASFYITGPTGWKGYCKITIPKDLMNPQLPEDWTVLLGRNAVTHTNQSLDNSTIVSFNYTLGASMDANRVRVGTGYPPTASFQFTPDPASTIEAVNFTDTSTSLSGTIIWRRWNFGDGQVVYNETSVSHNFVTKALFNVTLTVGDSNNLTDSVTRQVWVRNLSPSAAFTFSPTNISVGSSVVFDSSESRDPDGGIVEYRWSFGDGASQSSASTTVTHRFEHVGLYNLTLKAVDDDGGENETTRILSVGKGVTHIEIDAPMSVKVGDHLTINAALRDEDGQPLAGKQVRIEVYDGDQDFNRTISTNGFGIASATLMLNATGEYLVRASYIGSIDYIASEDTSAFSVNLLMTDLEINAPENATQNTEVTLTATLLDENGNPVQNATVQFYAHGVDESSWELLGASQTNPSGIASFNHTLTQAETSVLKATYNGDGKHAPSESSERRLEVTVLGIDYVPYIALAVLMASSSALLIIVLHRRKGKSSQSG